MGDSMWDSMQSWWNVWIWLCSFLILWQFLSKRRTDAEVDLLQIMANAKSIDISYWLAINGDLLKRYYNIGDLLTFCLRPQFFIWIIIRKLFLQRALYFILTYKSNFVTHIKEVINFVHTFTGHFSQFSSMCESLSWKKKNCFIRRIIIYSKGIRRTLVLYLEI